jgi:hypothetical protein
MLTIWLAAGVLSGAAPVSGKVKCWTGTAWDGSQWRIAKVWTGAAQV